MIKHTLFFTFLIFLSCEVSNTDDSAKQNIEELEIQESFYKDGTMKYQGSYYNDLKQGRQVWYFRSGNIEIEANYKNDSLDGLKYEYFDDSVKLLKVVSYFKSGIMQDSITFFFKNQTIKEVIYLDSVGKQKYGKSYYSTGELNTEYTVVYPYYLKTPAKNTIRFFFKDGAEDFSKTTDYVLSDHNKGCNSCKEIRLVGSFSRDVLLFYGDFDPSFNKIEGGNVDTVRIENGKVILDYVKVKSDTVRFTIHNRKLITNDDGEEVTTFRNIHGEFLKTQ
jgi:antitoxin component YwqK of YwqJK toxin-antitoxin module